MTDKGGVGVTVFRPYRENRADVNGVGGHGAYSRNFKYDGADLVQLGNLTSSTAHCEQFIGVYQFTSPLQW